MQVRLIPLSHTSQAVVAIVSTPIGNAMLTVDLTESNDLPLTVEMPSGTTYGSTVAFWNSHASGDAELDAREVIGSAVAFVIECLEQENRCNVGRTVATVHDAVTTVHEGGAARGEELAQSFWGQQDSETFLVPDQTRAKP